MDAIAWIGIAVAILALVVGALAVWMLKKRRKEEIQRETNWRTFFITGAIMTPIGLIFLLLSIIRDYSLFSFLPILLIGVVYLMIGLVNEDKWGKAS
jgi:uncharacterized membrane protein YhdT